MRAIDLLHRFVFDGKTAHCVSPCMYANVHQCSVTKPHVHWSSHHLIVWRKKHRCTVHWVSICSSNNTKEFKKIEIIRVVSNAAQLFVQLQFFEKYRSNNWWLWECICVDFCVFPFFFLLSHEIIIALNSVHMSDSFVSACMEHLLLVLFLKSMKSNFNSNPNSERYKIV